MYHLVVNITHDRASEISIRGYREFTDRKDFIKGYYSDESIAIREAGRLASENPTQQFAVFSVTAVYETTTPKVIVKKYNDQGELVLDK